MSRFDTFAMVDWSGGNDTGPRPRKDAIWVCVARGGVAEAPVYLRNRQAAEAWLADLIDAEVQAGRRLCVGFDFPFGYPAGFAHALTGSDDPFAVWDWLDTRIEDAPRQNNRFDLAGQINRALGDGRGPFWANGLKRDIPGLPRTKAGYANPFADRRAAEAGTKGAFTCWQLAGAGAVGSQVLMGLPVLQRLRQRFAGRIAVWPFEPLTAPVAFVEIWPGLLNGTVRADLARDPAQIRDAVQVAQVARALSGLTPDTLGAMLDVDAPEEGWILGLGHEDALTAALAPDPPPLRNDCFALPAGVDWTPVDDALALLDARLECVVGSERCGLDAALGRILAADVIARRSNPPLPNTAVDGYGFAGGLGPGPHVLPLTGGRAAAGIAWTTPVPKGHAMRVLTGAALPPGVDTVVLEEDVRMSAGQIAFNGPLKQGANTRRAGEDVKVGDGVLATGHVLGPPDLALLSAVGVADVAVRRRLRVAVLSTGDELIDPGAEAAPGQIHDANRPMLLAAVERFGFEAVDLGRVPDDRAALAQRLDRAAHRADVILTSGGASAGDEDHVSALLREAGAMTLWRIAVKPGRPLALGLWAGTPVFGLPGNPVAALVCTLIFARPAMAKLAGAGWRAPLAVMVPAAFEKSKKAGRREYLRARLRDGAAEVFASEGSGRISGLSWADGLVELDDGARHVRPGDPVRFLPYAGFGF